MAEKGLEKFKRVEILSNVMGIPITITKEVIGKACRRNVEGTFQRNLNKKTSDWIPVVKQSLFKGKKEGNYSDMEKEHKVLQKLMQECFLPKGGGVDQFSLEHKVLLHFFVTFEKVNLPIYIFHHMLWALEQISKRIEHLCHMEDCYLKFFIKEECWKSSNYQKLWMITS